MSALARQTAGQNRQGGGFNLGSDSRDIGGDKAEPEYCAECHIRLNPYDDVGPFRCHACGVAACCDRECLAGHKSYCAGALEAKARRMAARQRP